jgi:HSP20 family molecular chaperone IbpA
MQIIHESDSTRGARCSFRAVESLGRLARGQKWSFDVGNGLIYEDSKPRFDVVERQEEHMIKAELPGVNQDEVCVFLDGGILTISGRRKLPGTEAGSDGPRGSRRMENIFSQFYRPRVDCE